jgi:hypothetical protein
VVLASLWYGYAPPRSAASYGKRADYTLSLLHSQLQTSVLWADKHQQDRVTDAATVVAFEESAKDATVTYNRFTGYVPPKGRDRLLQEVTRVGSKALDALSGLRTAARRSDWAQVHQLAQQAGPASAALADMAKAASR